MLHLIWIICWWHHNPVWKISKIMFAWILSEQLAKSCSLWYFATSPDLYPDHLHGITRPNSITVSPPPLSCRDPPKTCCPWIVGVKLVSCLLGWHLYHLSRRTHPLLLPGDKACCLIRGRHSLWTCLIEAEVRWWINLGSWFRANGLGKGHVRLQKSHANMILLVVQTGWWYHQHYLD